MCARVSSDRNTDVLIFPTKKNQFSIKYLAAKYLISIETLTFLTQEAFPLALTLMKCLLPPRKANLLVENIHQEACYVLIWNRTRRNNC